MRSKIFIILLPFAVLFVANVIVAIGSAAQGAKLMSLESQIRQVEQTNKELTEKLVNNTSLTGVTQTADELGLATPTQVIYLTNDIPVAWKTD